MVKRLFVILFACSAICMASGTAVAQPDPGPGTYGFDQSCDQIHDFLDDLLPFGMSSPAADGFSALCKGSNAVAHPGNAIGAVRDKAWDTAFGSMVDGILGGLGQALALSMVWWTKLPNDRLVDTNLFTKVSDYTYQIQYLLLIASVIVSGIRLAEARRGAASEHAGEAFRLYARVVLSSWMLTAILLAAARGGDAFSTWLINDATDGNAQNIAQAMVETSSLQAFSPGLVLIIALVGILGALAQCVLAVIRQGLLIVAAGFLPVAAAASGLKTGMQAYQKLIGWVIAFLLWKPVAAIVYMIAFTTAGEAGAESTGPGLPSGDHAQRLLVGVVLLASVSFVLPALMRLVTPAVAGIGTGGSGLGTAGAAALVVAGAAAGGKALGARGAATPGTAGYVGGGGPRPSGSGGAPRPTPPPPPGPSRGGNTGGGGRKNRSTAAPAGSGGRTTGRSAAVVGAGAVAADRSAGSVAGDHAPTGTVSARGVIRR